MSATPGLPVRRAALRLLDAVFRRGETLEQAETAALGDVRKAPDRALAKAIAGESLRWLTDLDTLIDQGRIPGTHVFVDSPLANRITGVFERYATELEDTGRHNIFDNPLFHFVTDVAESIRLNSITGAVIMAASGMCEAGRIRHHLKNWLSHDSATLLLVGYQAEGSLWRNMYLTGAQELRQAHSAQSSRNTADLIRAATPTMFMDLSDAPLYFWTIVSSASSWRAS